MDLKHPPSHSTPDDESYRVMIVDDSSVIRGMLTRLIEEQPELKVVASVGDGQMAISALQRQPVDVIILDIEMPVMDGLTAMPKLLDVDRAVKIIVASAASLKSAENSIQALTLGAADYMPKPTAREMSGASHFRQELLLKILSHARAARKAGVRLTKDDKPPATPHPQQHELATSAPQAKTVLSAPPAANAPITLRPPPKDKPELIAIGSSTGGPQALFEVIKAMGKLEQPVIITQHMPPNFTTILAEHISRQAKVKCVEAKDGTELEKGVYYVAPGDYHMILVKRIQKIVISLTQTPLENFCRPAVDPMLRAAVALYGQKILAVILTGMGHDGWKGCQQLVAQGGAVVAQDEASSVVWGMPAAVARGGLCSAILPLKDIGNYVRRIATGGSV
jgi:two-component system, chemotaxis family, protein-glutamate methylesterase/glutaminase